MTLRDLPQEVIDAMKEECNEARSAAMLRFHARPDQTDREKWEAAYNAGVKATLARFPKEALIKERPDGKA
jgi:hypothetical protein